MRDVVGDASRLVENECLQRRDGFEAGVGMLCRQLDSISNRAAFCVFDPSLQLQVAASGHPMTFAYAVDPKALAAWLRHMEFNSHGNS